MKVLITGGAGFIGSHTADLLLNKGYGVRILDNLESSIHRQRQKPGYIPDDVEFIVGDVQKASEFARALRGVDAVFHLVAHQGYGTDFSKFARVNDGSTALLYEIIVKEHLPIKKVILASSQAVYGEGKYECPEHGVQYPSPRLLEQLERGEWEVRCSVCHQAMNPHSLDESRVNPHNQYSVSKYCQELYALTLGRRFGIPTVALRYSIVQGPRQSFYNAYSGILRIFITRLINNRPPIIYEDGHQLRDYVYVGDVARANLLVMENDAANFEVYNVAADKAMTIMEYTELLIRTLGKDIKAKIPGEFRYGDSRHVYSDNAKLKKLGWQPEIPMEQIVREYYDWAMVQPQIADYYAKAARVMKKEGIIRSKVS